MERGIGFLIPSIVFPSFFLYTPVTTLQVSNHEYEAHILQCTSRQIRHQQTTIKPPSCTRHLRCWRVSCQPTLLCKKRQQACLQQRQYKKEADGDVLFLVQQKTHQHLQVGEGGGLDVCQRMVLRINWKQRVGMWRGARFPFLGVCNKEVDRDVQ